MCWLVAQDVGTKQCNKGSQAVVSGVDVVIMAHNEGPCLPLCIYQATLTTYTSTHTHTCTGQAAARLSSPKIIRHQNEFPCFFSPPLVRFIHVLELGRLANAVNMLSSWIFITALHWYITRALELRLQGYHQHANSDRNTHTLKSQTHRKPMHLFRWESEYQGMLYCSVLQYCVIWGSMKHNLLTGSRSIVCNFGEYFEYIQIAAMLTSLLWIRCYKLAAT